MKLEGEGKFDPRIQQQYSILGPVHKYNPDERMTEDGRLGGSVNWDMGFPRWHCYLLEGWRNRSCGIPKAFVLQFWKPGTCKVVHPGNQ